MQPSTIGGTRFIYYAVTAIKVGDMVTLSLINLPILTITKLLEIKLLQFILEIMRFPSGKNFRGTSLPRIYSVSPYDQSNSNGLKDYSKVNVSLNA